MGVQCESAIKLSQSTQFSESIFMAKFVRQCSFQILAWFLCSFQPWQSLLKLSCSIWWDELLVICPMSVLETLYWTGFLRPTETLLYEHTLVSDLTQRKQFYVGQLKPWATNKAVIYYEICSLPVWVMGSQPQKLEWKVSVVKKRVVIPITFKYVCCFPAAWLEAGDVL